MKRFKAILIVAVLLQVANAEVIYIGYLNTGTITPGTPPPPTASAGPLYGEDGQIFGTEGGIY